MYKFNRTLFFISIFIMSTYLFMGCTKNTNVEIDKFAIYFVKPESKQDALSYGVDDHGNYIKQEVSIDSLIIEDTPVLTEKDIKSYNWNKHEIQLTNEYLKSHKLNSKKDSRSNLIIAKEFDAVLISVNGERIYCAGFPIDPKRSCFPPEYMMKDISKDTIAIVKNSITNEKDLRQNSKIYELFKEMNLLVE